MASLLSKFRIDYSALKVIPDISKPAQTSTKTFFDSLIAGFQESSADSKNSDDGIESFLYELPRYRLYINHNLFVSDIIKDSELMAMNEKTNRHLRLRELLLENSMEANLVVM